MFCLFIYKSLILHTMSHIRTMSSLYSIRRIWRWKETTELKRSNQRVMCICLCVSLWSKELQATLALISYTAEAIAVEPGDKRLSVWHFCFTDPDNLFQRNTEPAVIVVVQWFTLTKKNDWHAEFVKDLRRSNVSSDDQNNANEGCGLYNSTTLCY